MEEFSQLPCLSFTKEELTVVLIRTLVFPQDFVVDLQTDMAILSTITKSSG